VLITNFCHCCGIYLQQQQHPFNGLLSLTVCVSQHQKSKTHTQTFYGSLDFVRDKPSEPVPEETYTHSHLSWSSVIPYLLPPSVMIHGILRVQFMCLTVFFHNLPPKFSLVALGLAPSTSYSIHFFTQSLPSFHSTCPYHHNLFHCSTKIMSSKPILSLNPLLGTLSCSLMPHIHLTILISACLLKFHFIFLHLIL